MTGVKFVFMSAFYTYWKTHTYRINSQAVKNSILPANNCTSERGRERGRMQKELAKPKEISEKKHKKLGGKVTLIASP